MRAVEALEQRGEKAVSGLLIALDENDVEVCKRAAMALERIGYVERILDEYGKHKYKPEIKHVLFLVARAGVIESMSDKLTTSQVNLVKNIVRIFGEAGTKEASEPMLELLSHTSDWTLKARIIEALGKIGVQEAIPHLINYIKDNEYWVRKSSVDALGMLNARDYVDDIASILDDPNPMARESSLIALSGLKVSCHQEKIEKLLMDPSSKVRSTALTALRKLELTTERESVIGLLRDAAEEVRIEGIRYFAARENSNILDDIIQLLSHGSEAVRHEVVEYVRKVKPAHFQKILHRFNIRELPTESISSLIEIASLVRDKDAYQFTVNMTGCSDPLLRAVALDALIKFGLKGNEKFFEKGLFDPSEAVRVTAIACIASGPGKKLLEKAKPLSKDPDESVRVAFALALGASGFAECKTFATEMLDDPSESVVAGALVSLASFDDPILMEVFNSRKEIKQIRGAISVIKENPRFGAIVDTIRSRALETNNLAVKLLLAHDNRKFTDDLLTLLKESLNPTLRVEAMAMLRLIDISEFFTAILGIMKKDPSAEVRIRAMEAVITVERDDEIISALSSMLFDPVVSVRYRAAELLGQYKQPMAIEALTHALDSSDRQFREIVTTSLSQLLSEKPGKVNELVKSVPETRTRKLGMAWLMGKSRKRGALKYLLNLLDDVDPDVRASALGGIGKFRRKQLLNNDDQLLFDTFMKRLEKCIYDPNERVRAAVVNTITAIGGDRAFGIVASALEDSDEFVRRRVAIGLAQLDAKHSIELLSEKAEQLPDMRSYMRGISYAAGVSYDKTVKHDELATSIVNELCSKEKMYIHFTSSPDKNMRVHAFRVLTLISSDTAETLKSIAMNDPSPEVRDEAARYFKG
jgi:HEAT repeat protein